MDKLAQWAEMPQLRVIGTMGNTYILPYMSTLQKTVLRATLHRLYKSFFGRLATLGQF